MNEENLIPLDKRSKEDRQRIASLGGKARAKSIQRNKTMREQTELLLSLAVKNPKLKKAMADLGIPEDEQTNQMAMIISLMNKTITKGDTSAFNSLQATKGEKPVEQYEVRDTTNQKFNEICSQIGGEGLDE